MPLSSVTLTVADQRSAGAFVATLAHSSPAPTFHADLYAARVTGYFGPRQWSLVGQRDNVGTITGTVSAGYYWWYAVLTDTAPSMIATPPLLQSITTGTEALHELVMQAVTARATLALAGTDYTVQRLKIPFDGNVILPACIVTTFEQTETVEGGTSAHDYVGRPVYLVLVSNDAHDENTEPQLHAARQALRRAFTRRLPGVDEVLSCNIEPTTVLQLIQDRTEYQQSAYVVRCVCREPAGIGA